MKLRSVDHPTPTSLAVSQPVSSESVGGVNQIRISGCFSEAIRSLNKNSQHNTFIRFFEPREF